MTEPTEPTRAPRTLAVFGATSGCGACRIRFAPRESCPSCGAAVAPGPARFDARRVASAPSAIALRLAPWAPRSPRLVLVVAVCFVLPAVLGRIAFGDGAFASLSLVDDGRELRTEWAGLSPSGAIVLAAAGFGVALVAFLIATTGAARAIARAARRGPVEVFPRTAPDPTARAVFSGVARRATVEVDGPVAGRSPSLFFGVCGRVDDAELADAEGGDFDLELASGERIMVSLEHALFASDALADDPVMVAPDDELFDAFLATRGLRRRARECAVTTCAVHDGDAVTVEADVAGGAVIAGGAFRAPAARARVVSGTAAAPLVVRRPQSLSP